MNPWLKLLLPLGLGAIAAGINYFTMTNMTKPMSLVAVAKPLEKGENFTPDKLQKVVISGNVQGLQQSAIAWTQRAMLFGKPAPRDLDVGDVVLLRDATPPPKELIPGMNEVSLPVSLESVDFVPQLLIVGEEIGFIVDTGPPMALEGVDVEYSATQELVGPFRVLSVGERLSRTESEWTDDSGSDERTITIAIKLENKRPDPDAQKLIEAKSRGRRGQSGILAMIMYHSEQASRFKSSPGGSTSSGSGASE